MELGYQSRDEPDTQDPFPNIVLAAARHIVSGRTTFSAVKNNRQSAAS